MTMTIPHMISSSLKLGPLMLTGMLTSFMSGTALAEAKPDFSGLWFPAFDATQTPEETPFTEYAQQLREEYLANFEVSDDPGGFCIKPGLPRSIWGAPFPVEIVQTDEFITMFWEGFFQYRKIFLEGHDRPEPILHTRMGYSVGHWEGDTLVVETTHLREYPYMRELPNTSEATIVEHLYIENRTDESGESKRHLVNELTLTDPLLYTEPVTITASLVWSPDTPIMEYSCSEEIYEQHLDEKNLEAPDFDQR